MAERREPDETERLLAEVDGMLTGGGRPAVPVQRQDTDQGLFESIRRRVRGALLVGAVAGAGVWVLFAVLPFLRATSGGLGALIGATAATLLFRRHRA